MVLLDRSCVRTVGLWVPDHVVDGGVEVGVHDARRLPVPALDDAHPLLQQRVVVRGQVVEAAEAAEVVVVAAVGALVDGQVDREAPDRQHPGDDDVRRAQADQFLHTCIRANASCVMRQAVN